MGGEALGKLPSMPHPPHPLYIAVAMGWPKPTQGVRKVGEEGGGGRKKARGNQHG